MKSKRAILAQVQPVVSLTNILNEEESWAYNNQIEATANQHLIDLSWSRGYRTALKNIAHKMNITLNIAG